MNVRPANSPLSGSEHDRAVGAELSRTQRRRQIAVEIGFGQRAAIDGPIDGDDRARQIDAVVARRKAFQRVEAAASRFGDAVEDEAIEAFAAIEQIGAKATHEDVVPSIAVKAIAAIRTFEPRLSGRRPTYLPSSQGVGATVPRALLMCSVVQEISDYAGKEKPRSD